VVNKDVQSFEAFLVSYSPNSIVYQTWSL